MPFWASMLLIAVLGTLVVAAIAVVVLGSHRLPEEEPARCCPNRVALDAAPGVATSSTTRAAARREYSGLDLCFGRPLTAARRFSHFLCIAHRTVSG
jgi:hypothetical protein